jgi:hypothetical protein
LQNSLSGSATAAVEFFSSYRSQPSLEVEDTFAALKPQIAGLIAFCGHMLVVD